MLLLGKISSKLIVKPSCFHKPLLRTERKDNEFLIIKLYPLVLLELKKIVPYIEKKN